MNRSRVTAPRGARDSAERVCGVSSCWGRSEGFAIGDDSSDQLVFGEVRATSKRVARPTGIEPLHPADDIPPGPEFDNPKLDTQKAVAVRRKRPGWVIGLGAAAVVVIVVGIAAFLVAGEPEVVLTSDAGIAEAPILTLPTNSFVYFRTDISLTVVDVDAATATVNRIPELAPGDALYGLIRRGDVLVFYGETDNSLSGGGGPDSAAYALDPSLGMTPVLIDEAWFFVPSAAEDRVWLAILDQSSPATVRALKSVREVTVDGVVTVDDVRPPDGRWPVAAVDDGLVFQGDDTIEIWDPETQVFVETLPGPFVVATWSNRLVTCGWECDKMLLVDLDGNTHRDIDLPDGVAMVEGYGGAFSPDGRYVAVRGFDNSARTPEEAGALVVLIDFNAGTTTVVPAVPEDQNGGTGLAWSSDGEWLFISVAAQSLEATQLFAYRPGETTAYRVPVALDGEYFDMATG